MTETKSLDPEPRDLFASGDGWSWACAVCAIQRGLSYILRPPSTGSRTENVIDHFVSYPVIGWVVLAAAALMVVGMLHHRWRLAEVVGHIVCAAVYSLIASGVVLAALFLGQPWAASGAVAFIAAVHLSRVKAVTRGGTRP